MIEPPCMQVHALHPSIGFPNQQVREKIKKGKKKLAMKGLEPTKNTHACMHPSLAVLVCPNWILQGGPPTNFRLPGWIPITKSANSDQMKPKMGKIVEN